MRSFTLSAFASLAFGIFCSAAPTPANLLSPVAVVARDTTTPSQDTSSLQLVFTTATNDIKPLADRVATLQTVDAVEDVLCPILEQVVVILQTAVAGAQKLADIPVEDRLLDVTTGVKMDVPAIVQIIVLLVRIVLTLLMNVVKLVNGTLGNVLPLVNQIAKLLALLLSVVFGLIGDIVSQVLAGILALIQDLLPFIITLKVGELLVVLGIFA